MQNFDVLCEMSGLGYRRGYCLHPHMNASLPRVWGTLDPFVEAGPVIGRKVANHGFLQALLRSDPFDGYHFFIADRQAGQYLEEYLTGLSGIPRGKIRILPRQELPGRLGQVDYHCFHLSDCLTCQGFLSALRNRVSRRVFPVTGVTHSLSYARYGQAFAQHVWPGTTGRDSIVATSRAGAAVVRKTLQALATTMPEACVPRVDIIPLGLSPSRSGTASSLPLAVKPGKIMFFIPGRISPYSKMDILPVLRAFQRVLAAGRDLGDLCLVLAGGTQESAGLPGTLRNLAANIGLELLVAHCPDDGAMAALLDRADVVLSLAENPQETFGLTVLEAAAAGKPVIVSDYDGYRDLVLPGRTGLLVGTVDSGRVDDISLMAPLLYDTTYHLWLAQDVAVNVEELSRALVTMLDADTRQTMGAAATRHARQFEWPEIIARYVHLWEELNDAPAPEPGIGPWRHPLAPDYGRIFESYATHRLLDTDRLVVTDHGRRIYRRQDFPVVYAGVEGRVNLEVMIRLLVLARKPVSWADLRDRAGRDSLPTLMWMLKNDMLQIL